MVARGRAWLGPQGAADPDRPSRRDGPTSGDVTAWESEFFIPQQTPKAFLVPLVAATLSGMPFDERHRAGQHLPEFQHSLQIRQHQNHLPPARDDAVPPVLDQVAGPDAEHLRQ